MSVAELITGDISLCGINVILQSKTLANGWEHRENTGNLF